MKILLGAGAQHLPKEGEIYIYIYVFSFHSKAMKTRAY
jgi:hypothetical protein